MDIVFRDLQLSDEKEFIRWIKDKEVIKYSLSAFQTMDSDEKIRKWFSKLIVDKVGYNIGIVDKDNDKLIGYAGLCNLSKTNLCGEYFFFIGEKSYHGKGIGTFVTKSITSYGFKKLGLNKIMLTACENNIGAIKVYAKAGFVKEGVMRQGFHRDGKFYDKVIMSILSAEWNL